MRFQPLFIVRISHNYYTKSCQDFDFSFPADTVQLLKNGKLIAKVRDGKLYVLFATDETVKSADEASETVNPLVWLTGKTLRIGLNLLNLSFSNFTDLGFNFNLYRPLYRNYTTPDALDAAQSITLVGRAFSYSLKFKAYPVTVSLKDANGQVLQTDAITTENAGNGCANISYDLTGQAAGLYSVEESASGNTEVTHYYSDLELWQQGVFGVIEITIADDFYTPQPSNPLPLEFVIPFASKQETLKYYVLARICNKDSSNILDQLSVSDAGEEDPQINFTKILPADFAKDDDIDPNLLGNGDTKIVLFKSQILVTRREKARQNIQLKKNGEVLISHLPQPSANKVNADLIISLFSNSKSL